MAYSELCQTSNMKWLRKKLTASSRCLFWQNTFLHAWQGSEYIFGLLKLFCCRFKRDTREHLIYAKLIIVFTLNLAFSPCSEVIHRTTKFKLTKVYQRCERSHASNSEDWNRGGVEAPFVEKSAFFHEKVPDQYRTLL